MFFLRLPFVSLAGSLPGSRLRLTGLAAGWLLLLLLPRAAAAQREAYTWYFGQGTGLDFHHRPAKLLKGKINNSEGCATVSDGAGNLLFYTEGDTIWNRNHQVMPHGTGLKGHFSSTHNALAVPKPGDASTYYLFTVDHSGYFYTWPTQDLSYYQGLNYSEVNMCLDGGLGDVVESTKNQRLPGYFYSEKLTATRIADGSGYWVLTYLMKDHDEINSNSFRAYRVTAAGVDTVPVTSRVGIDYNDSKWGNWGFDIEMGIGQMKFSPDGRKLAAMVHIHDKVEIYDFDAATGKVSNPVLLYERDPWKPPLSPEAMDRGYGVEFSPDGSKLYASFNRGVVFQYDISDPTPAAMLASRTLVADFPRRYYESLGALQLGPDGRIYIPHTTERLGGQPISDYYLDVIEQPNLKGTACGYRTNAYPILAGPSKTTGRPGVPNVLPELLNFEPRLVHQVACDGQTVAFRLILPPGTTPAAYGPLTWDFGDGRQRTASSDTVTHRYAGPGTYAMRVTSAPGSGKPIHIRTQVITSRLPQSFLPSDTVLCQGQTLLLSTKATGLVGTWQDGSAGYTYQVTKAGTYWADVCRNGCTTRDSIRVEYLSPPNVSLGPDRLVCDGRPVTLRATTPAGRYRWSTGSTDSLVTVRESGTYWAAVQTQCGQHSDTVRITFEEGPTVRLGQDTTLCVGQVLTLNAFHRRATRYRWQGQDGGATYQVRTEGTYTVELLGTACKAGDTITVRFTECESELRIPNVFTPNGDGYNETFEVLGILPGKWSLEVYNRLGKAVYRQAGYQNDWRGEDLPAGVYYYLLRDKDTPRRYRGWVQILK